ncbi:MAG: electron transfer flavoprotein subunit beta/FixA family protein [Actinomycetota bacterium]
MPLRIAVCVKRVPDTAADKRLDPADFTLDRDSVESILNPVDEVAVEEALRLRERHGGEVTVVCAGPEAARAQAIRKALSMGCDRAVHLQDDALHGSDALAVAYALAQVLRREPHDLVVCGAESTDARTSLVPPALAELLDLPALLFVRGVEVVDTTVTARRETDRGEVVLEAQLPVLLGVRWGANEPRYPSFKGIMAAKNRPVESLTLANAGIDPARIGASGSLTKVLSFGTRSSARQRIIVDNSGGDAHLKLADFLQSQKFV